MPYATNAGVRIRYEVEGSGPPLLLHIGFIGGLEDWADAGYVAPLAREFRVLRLDPRGQGGSDKPHDPDAYTTPYRVGDILAVLDAEGIDRAHFWGYSLGGRVGFALGVFASARVASLIVGAPTRSPATPVPSRATSSSTGSATAWLRSSPRVRRRTRPTSSRPANANDGLPPIPPRCARPSSPT